MKIKKVGILYHPVKETALSLAQQMEKALVERGVATWKCSAWELELARTQLAGTDLILSVGGDGTILRAAQAVAPQLTPIVGVNLGRLGFMTELGAEEALEKLPDLLGGEGWIDERSLFEAELTDDNGQEPARSFYALNDVVVARGVAARVIYVEARIDGELMTTYRADGVILATATGSTAYSLAAGGPILYPESEDFLLVPILSHLSLPYPLVLPAETVIELRLGAFHPATLSIDGHINLTLASRATITVKRSDSKIRFLRVHPVASFYRALERKLGGK